MAEISKFKGRFSVSEFRSQVGNFRTLAKTAIKRGGVTVPRPLFNFDFNGFGGMDADFLKRQKHQQSAP
jgi:hypothetical protein